MLIELSPAYLKERRILLDLRYGTTNNFTGKVIYKNPKTFLHLDAFAVFEKAVNYAAFLNLRIKIFDAFRPYQAQEVLWNHCPDPNYVALPGRSNHGKGVAVDLTLCDAHGEELDMGTGFDDFSTNSHQDVFINEGVNRNRFVLLGIMNNAGFAHIRTEWWHYQLPNCATYPTIMNDEGMMDTCA